MTRILLVPPPQAGGGPSNAVIRCCNAMEKLGVSTTANMFSTWDAALLNVSVSLRFKLLRLLRLKRRIVYRADGCYVPEIFSSEGNPWNPEYDKINNGIRLALKLSDHVIYQSQFSKKHLDQLAVVPDGKYSVVPNGVDLSVFSPTSVRPHQMPVIGCIGSFRLNRIQTIVDIAGKLEFCHRLLLVGRMDEQCRHALDVYRSATTNSVVEHIEHVTGDNALTELHNDIDCFIHPYLSDWCPNAVIEALACGTPTLLPAHTGGSELIGKGGIAIHNDRSACYQSFTESFVQAIGVVLGSWKYYSSQARVQALAVLDVNDMAVAYRKALSPN